MFQLISIHALREEGDQAREVVAEANRQFLSTPSARRATILHPAWIYAKADFYPRPPRGGRRELTFIKPCFWDISIHALREEGDPGTA